jgi:nitrous oxidase accessory protein
MNKAPIEIQNASVFVIAALTLLMAVSCVTALDCACGHICVNETGWWRAGGDFNASNTPIQAAVDNATAGETICVQDGTYTENVVVNKSLTIQSEHGSANCIVRANETGKDVFNVTADWVNITGFAVQDATEDDMAGIRLNGSEHCTIADNNATNNNYGIYLTQSSNNTLINNTANSNAHGISLEESANNTLVNNTANSNDYNGIRLYESNYNILTGNNANSNNYGIFLDSSDNNTLTRNTATSNHDAGIYIGSFSQNNILTGNTATSNGWYGVEIRQSHNNTLIGNTATSNGFDGIYLLNSQNNTLLDNLAAGHKGLGGSFDVLLLTGASWTYQGEFSFRDYETVELPLTHGAGTFTLRLLQHGHDSAYVDYVALKKGDHLYEPVTAVNLDSGANISYKLVAPDYDVCDAWESTLELIWDSVPADTTLVMRAMEEDLGPGHGSPFYYPLLREGRTLSYTLANDGGIVVDGVLDESKEPIFSVFWSPDSPHPDGYTYGWLHADDQYLYAAVEVTADNTADEEDWGALFVLVNGELREFRVAPAETAWGQIGFQYTSAVPYEHRIYEFAIPLSVLNAQIGDEVHYGFGAYGTAAIQYAGIGLESHSDSNTLTGNRVTDNDIGIYLRDASENTITCNAVYKNMVGFLLQPRSENNTIERNGIIDNFRAGGGYNFENQQVAGVKATNNYWGTTVAAEIAASIHEAPGNVTYEPFLDAWPPCAPGLPEVRAAAVPLITPLGIVALIGLLSIVALCALIIRKKR